MGRAASGSASSKRGAERSPHGVDDRLVLTIGYSLAEVTKPDDQSQSADSIGTVFAAGVGYRINSALTIGAGRMLGRGPDHWYLSFSGDIGTLPFLKDLFARLPRE